MGPTNRFGVHDENCLYTREIGVPYRLIDRLDREGRFWSAFWIVFGVLLFGAILVLAGVLWPV